MGHGYHLYSDRRTLALLVRRAGYAFRARGGLVDASTARPPVGRPSRPDGVMAAASPDPSHSALGSGLPIFLRGIPTVFGGASGDLEHECRGQLRG